MSGPSTKHASPACDAAIYPAAFRAWLTVAVLMLAFVLSFVDRQILALLIDPIKKDLLITDVQISLLIDPAFALFFALTALPLGRLVDRRSRIAISSAGGALWSLMTILGGFASGFGALFSALVGVAVGEATLFPAANSLTGDSFPPKRRARAVGVFMFGISLDSGLAFLFGGAVIGLVESGRLHSALPRLLDGFRPWQIVLIVVGAPGLPVAALVAFIREPTPHERQRQNQATSSADPQARRPVGRSLYLLHFLCSYSSAIRCPHGDRRTSCGRLAQPAPRPGSCSA